VRNVLEKEPISAIFTSPMKRARQTAEIISEPHNLALITIDGFSEIDTGIFSNKSNSEVLTHGENFKDIISKSRDAPLVAQLLDHYPGLAFPGGESVGQMVQRVVEAWEDLMESIRNYYPVSVVVSHAGTQTVIMRHLSAFLLSKDLKGLKFSNSSITEVEVQGNPRKVSITRINDISHLQNI
jgi:broad specificity phosphatase PhoE